MNISRRTAPASECIYTYTVYLNGSIAPCGELSESGYDTRYHIPNISFDFASLFRASLAFLVVWGWGGGYRAQAEQNRCKIVIQGANHVADAKKVRRVCACVCVYVGV